MVVSTKICTFTPKEQQLRVQRRNKLSDSKNDLKTLRMKKR